MSIYIKIDNTNIKIERNSVPYELKRPSNYDT